MSTSTALTTQTDWAVMEKVVVGGDLAKLSPAERVTYVRQLTESLGMNPMTQPFQYMTLQGKMTLYATKNAAEQLRRLYAVNIDRIDKEMVGDAYVVTVYGRSGDRTDSDMAVVSIKGLQGDALANAMMKCMTKAKRRFTLSICGLGFLDESEVETIPNARVVQVDEQGVIVDRVRELPQRTSPPSPPPTDRQRLQARMWALAQEYFGGEGTPAERKSRAETALREWIAAEDPDATHDGNPSVRALSDERVAWYIAALETGIKEAAEPAPEAEQPAIEGKWTEADQQAFEVAVAHDIDHAKKR